MIAECRVIASLSVVLAVGRSPSLWVTAIRQARRTAPTGWWRRPPFLPVPAGDYLRFRLVTQYGDPAHRPERADVLNYLRWCREWEHGRG